MPGSDLAWMALHLEALYTHDEDGRLTGRNAPRDSHPPPRFHLGRTAHGNVWRFGAKVGRETVVELARLAAAEGSERALEDGPERLEPMRRCLERTAPIEEAYHGPAFRFPEDFAGPSDAGLVRVTAERVELLHAHFPSYLETFPDDAPYVALIEDGAAVSICHTARSSEEAAEAGVETAPAWRGRGLAGRVVAGWARDVADSGHRPLYSTWWENRASRAVARRLGLIPFGADLHFR